MKLTVVCLSLPRSLARRAAFDAEANRVGLSFEYVDGPDAKLLPAHRLLTLADQDRALGRYGRRLGLSEIACSEGHRQIYRNLLQSGDDGAVILEDDIRLDRSFVEVANGLRALGRDVGQRPEVYFLCGRGEFEGNPLWLSRRKPLRISRKHRLLRVVRSEVALLGTYGYFITRAAAAAILKNEPTISDTPDPWDLRLAEGVLQRAWVLEPPVVFHEGMPIDSLLDEERTALEAESADMKGSTQNPLMRTVGVSTSPRGLLRTLAYRLGWRRLKSVVYSLLSWVT